MDEKKLSQMIKEVNAYLIPDDVDIWDKIQREVKVKRTPYFREASRQFRLIAGIVAVVLTVSVALAWQQVIRFGQDKGLDAVQENIVPLDLEYINDGVRFTLNYTYADANRIVIGYDYHVELIARRNHTVRISGELRDRTGNVFVGIYNLRPDSGGMAGGGGSGNGEETPPQQIFIQDSVEQSFDASSVADHPEQITLSYAVSYHVESDVEGESYEGNFTFDFETPFNSGFRLSETVTFSTNEISLTVQEVVIAPSMTRIVVCMQSDRITFDDYERPVMVIRHHGNALYQGIPAVQPISETDSNCRTFVLPDALYNDPGDWQIEILELISTTKPPIDQLSEAFALDNIVYTPSNEGDDSFGLSFSDEVSENDHDLLLQRFEEIDLSLRSRWQGPWIFEIRTSQ